MRALCLSIIIVGVVPISSCAQEEPNWSERWQEIKRTATYADYCDMEICDAVEQGAEPPCDCWCDYDGDHGDDDSDGDGGGDGGCDDGSDDVCDGGEEGDGGGGDEEAGGDGCTLTQGYWKNHNELETNGNQARDWPAPYDERDTMCGQTLLDVFNTSARGEAWYILAHQFIAASLNAASGASTDGLGDELDEAEALLLASCGGISPADRPRAIELSELLDAFNNGHLSAPHCD